MKGHAGYERGTLEAVVEARNRAVTRRDPPPRVTPSARSPARCKQLLALAEAYPDLKAGESFVALQRTLTEIEDHIQNARRYYNAVVRDFNTRIAQFPVESRRRPIRVPPREFFGLADTAEGAVPRGRRVDRRIEARLRRFSLLPAPAAGQRTLDHRAVRRARSQVRAEGTSSGRRRSRAKFTGSWNGIYRKVPVEYRTPQGFNWTIELTLHRPPTRRPGPPDREQTGGSLHQVQDVDPRRPGCDPDVVLRYRVQNCAPVLRGPRRALLERDRR